MPKELLELSPDEILLPDPSKSLEEFQIGYGACAYVYQVKVKKSDGTEEKAAFKRFKIGDKVDYRATFQRELSVLNRISHKNITRLIGVCYDEKHFGILLELCEGCSFGSTIRRMPDTIQLPLSVVVDWAHQIAEGMNYLVKQRLVHRDLKADNILVKQNVCYCSDSPINLEDWCSECGHRPLNKITLKITDFGFTKTVMSAGITVAGTYAWMAPEAFNQLAGNAVGKFNWTEFADVWSFGVVMWEMLARKFPNCNGEMQEAVAYKISKFGQALHVPEFWPEKWKQIMKECWAMDPNERPRFEELLNCFDEYKTELRKSKNTEIIPYYDFLLDDDIPKNNENVLPGKSKRKKLRPLSRNRNSENRSKIQIMNIIIFLSLIILAPFLYFWLPKLMKKPTDCPETFQYFEETGYCYKTGDILKSYTDAVKLCEVANSTIVSIHSEAENNFVTKIVKAIREVRISWINAKERGYEYRFWIGLHNQDPTENWRWLDGTSHDFSNWESNETRNDMDMSGYAAAVVINTKKWRKEPTLLGNYYACKTNPF